MPSQILASIGFRGTPAGGKGHERNVRVMFTMTDAMMFAWFQQTLSSLAERQECNKSSSTYSSNEKCNVIYVHE